jgi:small-conductance mechanosensitive channel
MLRFIQVGKLAGKKRVYMDINFNFLTQFSQAITHLFTASSSRKTKSYDTEKGVISLTWLRTFDDNTVMVPNAEALKAAVSNANSGALDEMVVVCFTLPMHADHQKAIALAREATQCSPYTFLNKPIIVTLGNDYSFGQYQQTVTVKAYVMDVRLEKKFMSDINIRVLSAFKKAQFYDVQQTLASCSEL